MSYFKLEDGSWAFVVNAKGRLQDVYVPCDDDGVEDDAPESVNDVLEMLLEGRDISPLN